MAKLIQSKIDLNENIRSSAADILNARLADAVTLMFAAKQAHWNIKGPSFHGLHALFDEVYTQAATYVDMIAERVTALGALAEGTVPICAQQSILKPYPLDITSASGHIEALTATLAEFGRAVREAGAECGALGDAASEDVFVEISRGIDEKRWMVESYQEIS
jgi:starvation-inducible DNA-binding protein